MRTVLLLIVLSLGHTGIAQHVNATATRHVDDRISTIDFVQILDNNKEEALYYYENNWRALRSNALKKDHILSFQMLESSPSGDSPFDLILITTYANRAQYDKREDNFTELIKERGELRLLNAKKPSEFRSVIFSKDPVKHLN